MTLEYSREHACWQCNAQVTPCVNSGMGVRCSSAIL